MVKNEACERPMKWTKNAALQRAPSTNKGALMTDGFETRCLENIFSRVHTHADAGHVVLFHN